MPPPPAAMPEPAEPLAPRRAKIDAISKLVRPEKAAPATQARTKKAAAPSDAKAEKVAGVNVRFEWRARDGPPNVRELESWQDLVEASFMTTTTRRPLSMRLEDTYAMKIMSILQLIACPLTADDAMTHWVTTATLHSAGPPGAYAQSPMQRAYTDRFNARSTRASTTTAELAETGGDDPDADQDDATATVTSAVSSRTMNKDDLTLCVGIGGGFAVAALSEVKYVDCAADEQKMRAVWQEGLYQLIWYLKGYNYLSGTRLGFVLINARFAVVWLLASDQIVIEVPPDIAMPDDLTLASLADYAPFWAAGLPHDFCPAERGFSPDQFDMLWTVNRRAHEIASVLPYPPTMGFSDFEKPDMISHHSRPIPISNEEAIEAVKQKKAAEARSKNARRAKRPKVPKPAKGGKRKRDEDDEDEVEGVRAGPPADEADTIEGQRGALGFVDWAAADDLLIGGDQSDRFEPPSEGSAGMSFLLPLPMSTSAGRPSSRLETTATEPPEPFDFDTAEASERLHLSLGPSTTPGTSARAGGAASGLSAAAPGPSAATLPAPSPRSSARPPIDGVARKRSPEAVSDDAMLGAEVDDVKDDDDPELGTAADDVNDDDDDLELGAEASNYKSEKERIDVATVIRVIGGVKVTFATYEQIDRLMAAHIDELGEAKGKGKGKARA